MRAKKAAQLLEQSGVINVLVIEGGILDVPAEHIKRGAISIGRLNTYLFLKLMYSPYRGHHSIFSSSLRASIQISFSSLGVWQKPPPAIWECQFFIIGVILLASSLATLFISSGFIFVPLLIGDGLSFYRKFKFLHFASYSQRSLGIVSYL